MGNRKPKVVISKKEALDILDLLDEHSPNWIEHLRLYIKETDKRLQKMKDLFDPHDIMGL